MDVTAFAQLLLVLLAPITDTSVAYIIHKGLCGNGFHKLTDICEKFIYHFPHDLAKVHFHVL